MRKLLNTLFVTTPEAYLSRDGENVVVKKDNQELIRIPIVNIESIVSFGYMGASPGLMQLCATNNVSLCFLTQSGFFQGRVIGPIKGNVILRRKQYRVADDKEEALQISRIMIAGKIQNYRSILARGNRDYDFGSNTPEVERAISLLNQKKDKALVCLTFDELRGIEGDAASLYFSVFPHLIIAQKKDFIFEGRNRRPPTDEVNAMLSFVYTLIAHEVQSALESVGLDPYVGFLHTDRPGRVSLALDMMEELRAYLGDRLVLSLINRKQVSKSGFRHNGDKGIVMDDETKKTLISAWQKRKKEMIKHPYLEENIPIGLLSYVQAMLMARYLRNEIDNYPVFIVR